MKQCFINGFKGWLQTDEYPGYEAALKEHELLYPKDKIIHVACAAHIRRKFYDALLNGKSKAPQYAIDAWPHLKNIFLQSLN